MKKLSNKNILFGVIGVLVVLTLTAFYFLYAQRGDNRTSRISDDGAQTKIYFTPESNTIPVNTAFDVTVKFDARGNPVSLIDANVSFDTSKFTYVSADESTTSFESITVNPNIGPGIIKVVAESNDTNYPTGDNLTVVVLHFTTKAEEGSGVIQFDGEITIVGNNASVLYTSDTPSVTYTVGQGEPGETDIPTEAISPTETVAPTNPSPSSCSTRDNGDANCDGQINKTDYDIWEESYTNNGNDSTADFNNDGKVNFGDFIIWRKSICSSGPNGYTCQGF